MPNFRNKKRVSATYVSPFTKLVSGEARSGVCIRGFFYEPLGMPVPGPQVQVLVDSNSLEWSDDDGKTWRGLGQGRPI